MKKSEIEKLILGRWLWKPNESLTFSENQFKYDPNYRGREQEGYYTIEEGSEGIIYLVIDEIRLWEDRRLEICAINEKYIFLKGETVFYAFSRTL